MALALLSSPALADIRDDVLAGMQRCQPIPDDRTWLDCTYGAQQPMRAKLGLPPAPDFQLRLVPPAAGPQRQLVSPAAGPAAVSTGGPAPLPRRKASLFQIITGNAQPLAISPLASISYDAHGAFLVTLENGQVWHQVDSDSSTAKPRFKVGAKATIMPGAMGSYNFKTDQDSRLYKVEPRN
jgi:hypothetical protein